MGMIYGGGKMQISTLVIEVSIEYEARDEKTFSEG